MILSTYRNFCCAGLIAAAAVIVASRVGAADIKLPEVVVEAPRPTDEPALHTATVPITVIASNQVDAAGITTLQNLNAIVPNFFATDSATKSFGDSYGMRGLMNTKFFSDPALALYVDDVPYGNAFTYSTELYNVERIDVLRGPQVTTIGKNSPAGVVNIYTHQPGNRWEGNASVAYGSYNSQDYRGGFSAPVVKDQLFVGVDGVWSKRGGFMDNTALHTSPDTLNDLNGRVVMLWTPQPDWSIRFSATAEDDDDGVERIQSLNAPPYTIASDYTGTTKVNSDSEALRIAHTAPGYTISSVSARRYWKLNPFTLDIDFSQYPGNTAAIKRNQEQWTEELRAQSPAEQTNWQWLAGFFFATSTINGNDNHAFTVPPNPPYPSFGASETTHFTLDEDNYALFGHVMYTFQEKFDVTFGLRVDYTVKSMDRSKSSNITSVPNSSGERQYVMVPPKLTLGYHVSDTVLLYASTGLAYQPGGFSAFVDPPSSPVYASARTWANELGVNSSWLDHKLTTNLSLFWYVIDNYQLERSVPNSTDFSVINAQRVVSYGGEFEMTAIPAPGLTLTAALGYTHATFKTFTDPDTGQDLAGYNVPFVPEFTARLAAGYKHSTGLLAHIEWLAVGNTYFDQTNATHFEQTNYSILNARIGYEAKHFAVYLFGNNMTDTFYYANKLPELNAGVPGAPQTFGVMASVKY